LGATWAPKGNREHQNPKPWCVIIGRFRSSTAPSRMHRRKVHHNKHGNIQPFNHTALWNQSESLYLQWNTLLPIVSGTTGPPNHLEHDSTSKPHYQMLKTRVQREYTCSETDAPNKWAKLITPVRKRPQIHPLATDAPTKRAKLIAPCSETDAPNKWAKLIAPCSETPATTPVQRQMHLASGQR